MTNSFVEKREGGRGKGGMEGGREGEREREREGGREGRWVGRGMCVCMYICVCGGREGHNSQLSCFTVSLPPHYPIVVYTTFV